MHHALARHTQHKNCFKRSSTLLRLLHICILLEQAAAWAAGAVNLAFGTLASESLLFTMPH
jgi:hypothetical protein